MDVFDAPVNKSYLLLMSRYNAWANERVGSMAQALSDDQYNKDLGSFFGSVSKTLNHILIVDRMWHARIKGIAIPYSQLDLVVFEKLDALMDARRADDVDLHAAIDNSDDTELDRIAHYKTLSGGGMEMETRVGLIYAHMFNHATHHRGQIHTMISQLGHDPLPLDLVFYFREAQLAAEKALG